MPSFRSFSTNAPVRYVEIGENWQTADVQIRGTIVKAKVVYFLQRNYTPEGFRDTYELRGESPGCFPPSWGIQLISGSIHACSLGCGKHLLLYEEWDTTKEHGTSAIPENMGSGYSLCIVELEESLTRPPRPS